MDMTYSELRQQARRRLEYKTSGKTRVVVQVGRCGLSSGAAAVAEQLRIALSRRSEAYLVTTGCDGACFAAPLCRAAGHLARAHRRKSLL